MLGEMREKPAADYRGFRRNYAGLQRGKRDKSRCVQSLEDSWFVESDLKEGLFLMPLIGWSVTINLPGLSRFSHKFGSHVEGIL